ncbi:hypothetical protein BLNAU_15350 [Blattamonas nauphoetae]|uniref:Uncharacterized protein n=1 Tax=Blattamonas nauphoetae TaxID=2049346 RepID=A0ABQ9XE54_9EUKA|nr:hypothetical protein BLNAU_15350 [Blattamonas nauphoetae]
MILSTVQVFLLLCSVFQCVDEHYQDFDIVYEKILAETISASNSELRRLSFDDGFYWTNGIDIVSKSVELHGNKTGLTHKANVLKDRNRYTDETANGMPRKPTGVERWMLEVQNSSLTMRSFGLDAGMAGTTICLVVGSSIEVIDSELLSNMECSGFVLANLVGSGSSRIVIVGSSHKSSTRNVVLPLVGRDSGQLNKINEDWMGDEEGWSGGLVEREEIIGVGLSFDSTHFTVGTGPLFSFAGKSQWSGSDNAKIGVIGEISTELRSTSISNVTTSYVEGSGRRKNLGFGSCVWERVVGSRISGSTNHDMGTGLCGTGLGFNVLCANSSFSSCVRTSNDEIDIERKNITQDVIKRTLVSASTGITSVKFTLCTFNDMTVAAGNSLGGAAICLNRSESTLTVTQCFFHKCTSTAENDDGGTICVRETVADSPISLTCCSFTECSNTGPHGNYGGCLFSLSQSTICLTDCFFKESQSLCEDGAVSLWNHPLATLSNCAFVSCSAQKDAGALAFRSVTSIDLSFLQFRDCSSTDRPDAKDIFFKSISASLITEETVRFCDTTSDRPNVYVDTGSVDMSRLVPKLESTPTVSIEVSFSEGTATVTATASEEVQGTMGILLKGSNVPRLVHVQFGSNSHTSRSGSTVVSSDDDGVLPPADYEIYASSMPSNYLSSLRIIAAECSLKDVNTTRIILRGMNLGSGSYSMLIRNGANTPFNISLTRSDMTTLVGEVPLHPSSVEGRLEWGTEYKIETMMWLPQGGIEENVRLSSAFTISTPNEPARICSFQKTVLNNDRTIATVTFEGRVLTEDLGSIWVKFGSTFWESSSSIRNLSETLCEVDFLVASEESETSLKYERQYTACIKPLESSTLLVDSGIAVRIPGPPTLTDVKFEFTNSVGTECFAIFTGTNLVVGTEYEVRLNTTHTFSIVVTSSTRAESSEMVIGLEGTLVYSQNILIETIEPTDSESGIALTPSPFTGKTPARPTAIEVFVDTETGQMDEKCGIASRPCSTMDVAWKIVRTLEISQPTFSLLKSTSLSSPMTIGSGMSVLMQNGTNSGPSLSIPSSAAESATSALIVVSSALLNMQNIDIVVGSSKLSFVLISASSSEMILKDGLITVKDESARSGNEIEDLCVWKTGLIELTDTELDVRSNEFLNISQGAIVMKGGKLTIDGSIFRDNIPPNSLFSSARRNIACSSDGKIEIGSLSAGDGSSLHPSAWISSEGCSIESTEMNSHAPRQHVPLGDLLK